MWARIKLRIGWRDLLAGGIACLPGGDHAAVRRKAETYWHGIDDAVAAYSVRSGFDLLLQALDLDEGDEVIFSALNVKGMINIARRAGLTPVPVDLDIDHFGPRLDKLKAAITPRSKVLVVAHLFGTILELDALFDLAREHGLLIVEDCAQVFDGQAYTGHAKADVHLFSFGPLKTATALGGALIRVRDAGLREKMRTIQAEYPVQKTGNQFKRVLKFATLKILTSRPALGGIYWFFNAFGRDYEDALSDSVRNVAKLGSAKKLRYQPCTAMLRLMNRRLYTFREGELEERAAQGRRLRDLLGDAVVLPGQANAAHSYWVFPLIVDQPNAFVKVLRAHGFDAANLPRSQAVSAPDGRPDLEPKTAAQALTDLIVVPCHQGMPDRELVREAEVIKRAALDIGTERTKAYASDRALSKSAA